MLKNSVGIASLTLISPQVACAISVGEVVVLQDSRPQSFKALPQTLFVGGEEYRVHASWKLVSITMSEKAQKMLSIISSISFVINAAS